MSAHDKRQKADLARSIVEASLTAVRGRLSPQSLLQDGKALAKERAVKVAAATLASGKGRPLLAAGAVAAGALYLFRKPLARALKTRLGKGD